MKSFACVTLFGWFTSSSFMPAAALEQGMRRSSALGGQKSVHRTGHIRASDYAPPSGMVIEATEPPTGGHPAPDFADPAGMVIEAPEPPTSGLPAPEWTHPAEVGKPLPKFQMPLSIDPSRICTGYWLVGCTDLDVSTFRVEDEHPRHYYNDYYAKEDMKPMTVEVCWNFCSKIKGASFFGLEAGSKCFCAPWLGDLPNMKVPLSECDLPCEGEMGQICGGRDHKATVFQMHDCTNLPPTKCTRKPPQVPGAKLFHSPAYYGMMIPCKNLQKKLADHIANRRCEVECEPGYEDIQNDIVCEEMGNNLTFTYGEFHGSAICTPIECGTPPVVKNTVHFPAASVYYGDVVTYTCIHGYSGDHTPAGPHQFLVNCQETGQFSAFGKCVPILCGDAPQEPYTTADRVGATYFPEEIKYTCVPGYTLDKMVFGDTSYARKCEAGGGFSAGRPCQGVSCGGLPIYKAAKNTAKLSPNKTLMQYPDVFTYKCSFGHTLDEKPAKEDGSNNHFDSTCEPTTGLVKPDPGGSSPCQPVSCGMAKQIPFAIIHPSTDVVFEDKVTYSCEEGYTTTGQADGPKSFVIVCDGHGNFTGMDNKSCLPVSCGDAEPENKSKILMKLTRGKSCCVYKDQVEYMCDPGYSLLRDDDAVHPKFLDYKTTCKSTAKFSEPGICVNINNCKGRKCGGYGKCVDIDPPTGIPEKDWHCHCDSGYEQVIVYKKAPAETSFRTTSSKCVQEKSLGKCEQCLKSEQCGEGRYCCPFMKKCVMDSSESCFQPIANCGPVCHDSDDNSHCTCENSDFPANWQLPTCINEEPEEKPKQKMVEADKICKNIDDCPTNSSFAYECSGGGTCKDLLNAYTCICKDGYQQVELKDSKNVTCVPMGCGPTRSMLFSTYEKVPWALFDEFKKNTKIKFSETEMFYTQPATKYTCDKGFTLDGNATGTNFFHVKCGIATGASGSGGSVRAFGYTKCVAVMCGEPKVVKHAKKAHTTVMRYSKEIKNRTMKYTCNPGYTNDAKFHRFIPYPHAAFEVECNPDGKITGYEECVPVVCPNVPKVENANPDTAEDSVYYPAIVKYTCDEGYSTDATHNPVMGSFSISCQTNGRLTKEEKCLPISCGKLPVYPHSKTDFKGALVFKQKAKFQVDHGYSLNSKADGPKGFTVHCALPVSCGDAPEGGPCQPISCGDSPGPCIWVSCGDSGGPCPDPVSCGDDVPGPCIQKVKCGTPPHVNHSIYYKEPVAFNETVNYTCKHGYTTNALPAEGKNEGFDIKCKADGTYSATQQCKAVLCPDLPTPKHASLVPASQGSVAFPKSAHFKCNPGYWLSVTFLSKFSVQCQANGTFKKAPSCINIDDCKVPDMNICNDTGHGTCKDKENPTGLHLDDYECLCDKGFKPDIKVSNVTGKKMRYCKNIDDCPKDDACSCNPGTCEDLILDYKCHCPKGWFPGNGTTSDCKHSCWRQVCGMPPKVGFATVNASKKQVYQDVLEYTCDMGYTLSGEADGEHSFTVTCGAQSGSGDSGIFSMEYLTHTCKPVKCGEAPKQPNSNKSRPPGEEVVYPEVIDYTCHKGFSKDQSCDTGGGETRFKMSCTGQGSIEFVGNEATCQPVLAGTPKIKNVNPFKDGPMYYPENRTVECKEGYSIDGKDPSHNMFMIKAEADCTITIPEKCKILVCGKATPVKHSTNDAGDKVQVFEDVVTYTGDTGYTLNGKCDGQKEMKIVCNASGLLDHDYGSFKEQKLPFKPVSCGAPQPVENAIIYDEAPLVYGQSVRYDCISGYSLDGKPGLSGAENMKFKITCTETCKFDGIKKCIPVVCGKPLSVKHAVVVSEMTDLVFKDRASYKCKPGYSLDEHVGGLSTFEAVCQASGSFTGIVICKNSNDCEGHQCGNGTCVDKPDPTGVHFDDYTCDCKSGFKLETGTKKNGEKYHMCGNIPDCPVGACLPGTCQDLVNDYKCICPAAYHECPNEPEYKHDCCPDPCGTPPLVMDATCDQKGKELVFGDKAKYTCAKGYTLDASATGIKTFEIECALSGSGTVSYTETKKCQKVECSVPPQKKYASLSTKDLLVFEDTVTYTCNDGYSAIKDPKKACETGQSTFTMVCTAEGKIVNKDGSDEAKVCKALSAGTPNAKMLPFSIFPDYEMFYPDSDTVTCKHGYSTNANNPSEKEFTLKTAASCGFEPHPTCVPLNCGKPLKVEHTTVDKDGIAMLYNDTAIYTADECYTIDGTASGAKTFMTNCTATGKLNSIDPFTPLLPISCGIPREKEGATRFAEVKTCQQKVTYVCKTGYSTDGKAVSGDNGQFEETCLKTGKFTDTGRCVLVECATLPTPEFSVMNSPGGKYFFNHTLHFECLPGYSLDGVLGGPHTFSERCQANGKFSATVSGCVNSNDCTSPDICGDHGTCSDNLVPTGRHIEDYNCTCDSGYKEKVTESGRTCQNADDCTEDACKVFQGKVLVMTGICVDLVNDYECICPEGGFPMDSKHGCGLVSCGDFPNPPLTSCKDSTGGPCKSCKDSDGPCQTFNKTWNYDCEEGYTLDGSPDGESSFEVTCMPGEPGSPEGKREGEEKCVPVDCGYVPNMTNATPSAKTFVYPQVVTYTCEAGFSTKGHCGEGSLKSFSMRCGKDGFPEFVDAEHFECRNNSAGTPNVSNAFFWEFEMRYPAKQQVTCAPGYSTKSDDLKAVNFWINTTTECGFAKHPTCEPIECEVKKVIHTTSIGSNLYGETRNYTCDLGYAIGGLVEEGTRVDTFTTMCEADGQFSGYQVCEPVKCGAALDVEYTIIKQVKQEYVFNENVTYECVTGTTITGFASGSKKFDAICNHDAVYEGMKACKLVVCPNPVAKKGNSMMEAPEVKTANVSELYNKLDGDCYGANLKVLEDIDLTACLQACSADSGCTGSSYGDGNRCVLKNDSCSQTVQDGWTYYEKACVDLSGAYSSTGQNYPDVTLSQTGCSGSSDKDGWTYTVKQTVTGGTTFLAAIAGGPVTGTIKGEPGSYTIAWNNGLTYTPQASGPKHGDNVSYSCLPGYSMTGYPPTKGEDMGYEEVCQADGTVTDTAKCIKINWCTVSCGGGGTCVSGPLNSTCDCPPGYESTLVKDGDSVREKCTDIDECITLDGNALCGVGNCSDSINKFRCKCPTGYTAMPSKQEPRGQYCKVNQCKKTPKIPNADSSPFAPGKPVNFPTNITYTCNVGFTLDGTCEGDTEFVLRCQADTTFRHVDRSGAIIGDGRYPTCKPIYCGELPVVNNTKFAYTGPMFFNSPVANYTCATGFSTNGDPFGPTKFSIRCLSSCELNVHEECKFVECGDAPMVSMATYVPPEPAMVYNDIKNYTCEEGYSISGRPVEKHRHFQVLCNATGDIEGILACMPVSCGRPPVFENSEADTEPKHFGQHHFVNCSQGYTTDATVFGNTSFFVPCLATGKYNITQSCKAVTCGVPQPVLNAVPTTTAAVFYKQFVVYKCNKGFSISGLPDGPITFPRHCMSFGQFTGRSGCKDINYCSENPCGNGDCYDATLTHGRCKTMKTAAFLQTLVGQPTACNGDYECVCAKGYETTIEDGVLTCTTDDCHGRPCGKGGSCTDLSGMPGAKEGAYSCTCFPGYVLELIPGSNPEAYTCVPVMCEPSPPAVTHSTVKHIMGGEARKSKYAVMFKDKLQYSCLTGYSLDGEITGETTYIVRCAVSTFLEDVITGSVGLQGCTAISCGVVPNFSYAELQDCGHTDATMKYQDVVGYRCLKGYSLDPMDPSKTDFSVTCQANAQFTGGAECYPVQCPGLTPVKYAVSSLDLRKRLTYNEYAEFKCNKGYYVNGSMAAGEQVNTDNILELYNKLDGDCYGNNYKVLEGVDLTACLQACSSDSVCTGSSYGDGNRCVLKKEGCSHTVQDGWTYYEKAAPTGSKDCVEQESLGKCDNCLNTDQCGGGRFCCPFMKKCVIDSSEQCVPPVAQCTGTTCKNADFPAKWQLPTCEHKTRAPRLQTSFKVTCTASLALAGYQKCVAMECEPGFFYGKPREVQCPLGTTVDGTLEGSQTYTESCEPDGSIKGTVRCKAVTLEVTGLVTNASNDNPLNGAEVTLGSIQYVDYKTSFGMTDVDTYCHLGSDLKSATACQAAAETMGVNFAGSVNNYGGHQDCYFDGNDAYYNRARVASSTPAGSYRSLCYAGPGMLTKFRILPAVDTLEMGSKWTVTEFEAYYTNDCTGDAVPIKSTFSSDGAATSNAFDGSHDSAWTAGCSNCAALQNWIGFETANPTVVRCVKVWQGAERGCAPKLRLQGQALGAKTWTNLVMSVDTVVGGCTNMTNIPAVVTQAYADWEGRYSVKVSLGSWQIIGSMAGFICNRKDVFVDAHNAHGDRNTNLPLSAELAPGEWRLVLEWAKHSEDLDMWLILGKNHRCRDNTGGPPYDDGSYVFQACDGCYVYFNEMAQQGCLADGSDPSYCCSGTSLSAYLENDDTTGYGPETIRIQGMNNCLPSAGNNCQVIFAVDNYTPEDPAADLGHSGGKVEIYSGDRKRGVVDIPATAGNKQWVPLIIIDAGTDTYKLWEQSDYAPDCTMDNSCPASMETEGNYRHTITTWDTNLLKKKKNSTIH